MNTEALISEIFKRKAIWDIECDAHSKRDIVKNLWDEVAEVMQSDKEAVKKRWKNLRDTYRLEAKRSNEKLKSGSAAGIKRIKWTYYDSLHFLRDVFEPAPLEGNIPSPATPPNNAGVHIDINSPVEYPDTFQLTSSTSQKKSRKRKEDKEDSIFISLEKEKLKLLAKENEKNSDSDYNFLISCLPHLKSLSQLNNLKFRTATTQLLMDLKEEELNERESYPYAANATVWENLSDNTTQGTVWETESPIVIDPLTFSAEKN